jgi:glycyl-tRNA synthetase beta chain
MYCIPGPEGRTWIPSPEEKIGVLLTDKKNLLLEIGTEELPSSCILEGISGLKSVLEETLREGRVIFSDIKTFATPRRIVAFIPGIAGKQQSNEKIITGPPRKISFGDDGKPTEAAIGFARSLNVDVSRLQEIDSGNGIYMGLKVMEESKPVEEILPDLLKDSILSLSFSKQMTWGDYSVRFARPIRWLAAIYDGKTVKFNIENVSSSDITFGIRSSSKKPLKIPKIKKIEDYFNFLEKNGDVVLDSTRRREIILDSIKEIEGRRWKNRFGVVIDEELLDEVVNLVEIPNVLAGSFPEEYLYIPSEILIKAIQHHQRYFAVIENDGKVASRFVVVQNGVEDKDGEVISGNERVLKARLSDARFFYEEDRKHDFNFWYKKLEGVIFYSGLGSLHDRAVRLKKNCIKILNSLEESGNKKISSSIDDLSRASTICKCDLVTHLVVEFPELQGLVGMEYAKEKGEKPDVAKAVFEHYLPRFAGDILPETDTGSILSIADRIDTITGMFLADNIPSGSQDPFALRRKASGIILTALARDFDVDIKRIAGLSLKEYLKEFDFKEVDEEKILNGITDFIMARYRFRLEKASKKLDLFDSIVSADCYSIIEIDRRYNALEQYTIRRDIVKNIAEPFIRCKNIIKGEEFSEIRSQHLIEASEKRLHKTLLKKKKSILKAIDIGSYGDALAELEDFGRNVNDFFDNVLVMDKDKKLRTNRINIVKGCADLYLLFADFSNVS